MKQLQRHHLASPQNEHVGKNHYMNVNTKPTAFQQNKKKLHVSKFFQFSLVSMVINLCSPRIFRKKSMAPMGYSGAREKLIHEKSLKSKILCAGIEGILCTIQSSYCTDSAAYTQAC
jgi:hypothetical protein